MKAWIRWRAPEQVKVCVDHQAWVAKLMFETQGSVVEAAHETVLLNALSNGLLMGTGRCSGGRREGVAPGEWLDIDLDHPERAMWTDILVLEEDAKNLWRPVAASTVSQADLHDAFMAWVRDKPLAIESEAQRAMEAQFPGKKVPRSMLRTLLKALPQDQRAPTNRPSKSPKSN